MGRLEHIKYIKGDLSKTIEGIAYDSRKVGNNYIFVATKGLVYDGHDFIKDAVENGASAVIAERELPLVFDRATQIIVNDSKKALAVIAKAFYNDVDEEMCLIGITGTNGKTTTTYLIKDILENSGKKVGLIGTICNKIGDKEFPTERTTPESLDIFKLFKEMHENNVKDVVMEVSSHGLALQRVHGLRFDIGIFTNLTQDHLDFHGDLQNYYSAKKKLFELSQIGIINIDDNAGKRLFEEIDIPKISYGIRNPCDIRAEDIRFSPKGVNFKVIMPSGESEIISINTPGIFSVYNALASISAGFFLGIKLHKIKEALMKSKSVPGRFEVIDEGQDFQVIVDYAHSPDGLENILKGVKEFTTGKIILVFGCGGNRDKTKRPIMGKIAAELSDYVIVTSDNPRFENPEAIASEIEKGIKQSGGNYVKILNRKDAIEYAIRQAHSNDTVVIAGKGHETIQIIGDRNVPFDDRKVAREVLRRIKKWN